MSISFGWPVLRKVSMGLQASSTGPDQGPHVGPCVGTKPAEHFAFVSTSISSWTKERTDSPPKAPGASPAGALLRAQHTTQEGDGRQRPGLTLQARPGQDAGHPACTEVLREARGTRQTQTILTENSTAGAGPLESWRHSRGDQTQLGTLPSSLLVSSSD